MRNISINQIRSAILTDTFSITLSYVTGLQIPSSTLLELLKILVRKREVNYVDWVFENWATFYNYEINKCVRLEYKGKQLFLPQTLEIDNTQNNYQIADIEFVKNDIPFELSDDIRSLTELPYKNLLSYYKKKKKYFKEQNCRLNNILRRPNKLILDVQPVDYSYFVHSNLVLDAKFKSQTLRELLHSNGRLEPLDKSLLANHIGIGIILFTADGSLIIQKRSKKVAFRINELCPSGSGAMPFADLPCNLSLNKVNKFREAFEEIGITEVDIDSNEIVFLGLTRELIRGGKPEMFLMAKTKQSEENVLSKWKDARDNWESNNLVFFNFGNIALKELTSTIEKHRFLLKVDEFIEKYYDFSSIPLLTAIALWTRWKLS